MRKVLKNIKVKVEGGNRWSWTGLGASARKVSDIRYINDTVDEMNSYESMFTEKDKIMRNINTEECKNAETRSIPKGNY